MSSSRRGGQSEKSSYRLSDNFFGTATVGDRGQIVIPSEARKQLQIETGDKLLVVGHGEKGVMLFKIDALREFISAMMEDLQIVEQEFHQDKRQDFPKEENA